MALGEKWGTEQGWGEEKSKHLSSQGQTDGLKPSLHLTVMTPQDCHGHLVAKDLGQGTALCWPSFPLLATASNHLSRAHALPAAAAVGVSGGRQPGGQMQTHIPQSRGKLVHSVQPSSLLFPRVLVGMADEQQEGSNTPEEQAQFEGINRWVYKDRSPFRRHQAWTAKCQAG